MTPVPPRWRNCPVATRSPDRAQMLTAAEAASALGIAERVPGRLSEQRLTRFVRVGRHVRIPESALREFITAGLVEPVVTTRKRRKTA